MEILPPTGDAKDWANPRERWSHLRLPQFNQHYFERCSKWSSFIFCTSHEWARFSCEHSPIFDYCAILPIKIRTTPHSHSLPNWWIKELLLLNLFGDTTANYPIISLLTHTDPSSRIRDTCYKSTLQKHFARLSKLWNLTLPWWSCTWDCSMDHCPSTKEQSPLSLKVSLSLKWSTTWSGRAFQQAAQVSAKSLRQLAKPSCGREARDTVGGIAFAKSSNAW